MDFEKQLLSVRVSNLETFMESVCQRLKCLPDYNDSLPTKGNSHVINKLDALLKDVESPNSATGQPEKVSLPEYREHNNESFQLLCLFVNYHKYGHKSINLDDVVKRADELLHSATKNVS